MKIGKDLQRCVPRRSASSGSCGHQPWCDERAHGEGHRPVHGPCR